MCCKYDGPILSVHSHGGSSSRIRSNSTLLKPPEDRNRPERSKTVLPAPSAPSAESLAAKKDPGDEQLPGELVQTHVSGVGPGNKLFLVTRDFGLKGTLYSFKWEVMSECLGKTHSRRIARCKVSWWCGDDLQLFFKHYIIIVCGLRAASQRNGQGKPQVQEENELRYTP